MRPGRPARRRPGGFTLLGLLVVILVLGLVLGAAGEVASTAARREREAELLWVGHEYRAAIGRYWLQRRAFPPTLQDLLGTPGDAPVKARFLRRLYPDPMTGALDWVLLPAPSGGIMGIASSSSRAPLKAGGFDAVDLDFDKATTYGDWQFSFLPALGRRRGP